MIFSPTYFYPFEPVLTTLQRSDDDPCVLEVDVVTGKPSADVPVMLGDRVHCAPLFNGSPTGNSSSGSLCVCGTSAGTAGFGEEVAVDGGFIDVVGVLQVSSPSAGRLVIRNCSNGGVLLIRNAKEGIEKEFDDALSSGELILPGDDVQDVTQGATLIVLHGSLPMVFRVMAKGDCCFGALDVLADSTVTGQHVDDTGTRHAAFSNSLSRTGGSSSSDANRKMRPRSKRLCPHIDCILCVLGSSTLTVDNPPGIFLFLLGSESARSGQLRSAAPGGPYPGAAGDWEDFARSRSHEDVGFEENFGCNLQESLS